MTGPESQIARDQLRGAVRRVPAPSTKPMS